MKITLSPESNIGSVQKLELVLAADVESFYPIVLKAGKAWDEIELHPEGAVLSLNVADTEHGNLYRYQLRGNHNLMRDEAEDLLNKYVGIRSVIRVMDMNDRVYVLGSPALPCTFAYAAETGSNPAETNAYNITASVSLTYKAKSA